MREYLTECIGTFFLVFTVCLTVLNGTPGAALAIGASLMIMVYMGGHISGGHYNPAVTLAVWMRGKLSGSQVIPYWIAQLVGGIVAGLISYLIMGKSLVVAPAPSATVLQVLVVEFLFAFALCLVVLQTATNPKTSGNSYYGLAIGFTVTVGAYAAGGVSGGAFNPAVGTGPAIASMLTGGGTMSHVWLYIVGGLLGGAAAAAVYKVQSPEA
ncbi:MAG TPA: aquaporin [Gemmatimonadaceae bacterium]